MILDGWGLTKEGEEDISAIAQADTPFIDKAWQENPHSQLKTDGTAAGLPEAQMGNSEVGHINLGASPVVYQELVKINLTIDDHNLHKNKNLLNAHTTHPVPCILLGGPEEGKLKDGKLGDVIPTTLKLMGIEKPEEMSGSILLEE